MTRQVQELTTMGPAVDSSDPAKALAALKARMDAGGMVIVHQEIYENDSTPYADIVLPAATWGEENFARNNSERRLRLYEKFMDAPGEAKPDWWIFAQATLAPSGDELWVLNGRINAVRNNMFDHIRQTDSAERWPMNFLEINEADAADAADRDIVSGDLLSIGSDKVLDPSGTEHRGSFTAVAYVSDTVPPGVTFTYFLYPGSPGNAVTSADSSLQPMSLRYNFKLGRGAETKIGETDLASVMTFVPRNLAPTIETAEG